MVLEDYRTSVGRDVNRAGRIKVVAPPYLPVG